MIVSVEKAGEQIASVTSFNKALLGSANEIEKVILGLTYPISSRDIVTALRSKKETLGLEGAKLYFKSDRAMRFGPGISI